MAAMRLVKSTAVALTLALDPAGPDNWEVHHMDANHLNSSLDHGI